MIVVLTLIRGQVYAGNTTRNTTRTNRQRPTGHLLAACDIRFKWMSHAGCWLVIAPMETLPLNIEDIVPALTTVSLLNLVAHTCVVLAAVAIAAARIVRVYRTSTPCHSLRT